MSAELLDVAIFLVCSFFIMSFARYFGKSGLMAYNSVVVIISNIQVLKLTKYSFITDSPIALGTVVFSTTFAIDNILTEFYGADFARKNIKLGFILYLFFTICLQLTILYPVAIIPNYFNLHDEIKTLFSPSVIIFISSVLSYIIGQHLHVCIFSFFKEMAQGKFLGMRNFFSMAISAFIDNLLFSFFAWKLFSPQPVSWSVLWDTYIFTTYLLRLLIAVLCVPLVELTKLLIKKNKHV